MRKVGAMLYDTTVERKEDPGMKGVVAQEVTEELILCSSRSEGLANWSRWQGEDPRNR